MTYSIFLRAAVSVARGGSRWTGAPGLLSQHFAVVYTSATRGLHVTQTERDLQVRQRERESSEGAHAAIRARLSDYLDGSLPPSEVADIRQHLDGCAACQAFWRTLLRVVNTAGQLPRRHLPQAVQERVQAQLDAAHPV